MNLETKITIYKFTPQVFTLTRFTPKNVKSGVFVLFKIIQPLHNKRVAILKESDEKRLIFIYPFTLIFQDFTSS